MRGDIDLDTILEIFFVRSPSMEDAAAVTDFVAFVDTDEFGFPDIEIQDVLDLWNTLPLNKNVWIVETKGAEQIVGYGFVEETATDRLYSSAFVHPQYKGRGIGTHLLELIDTRAHEIRDSKDASIKLDNVVPADNKKAIELLEMKGYHFNRLYQRMRIDIVDMPEVVIAPIGVVIRPYSSDLDAVKLYETYRESFQDSREFSAQTYDEWSKQKHSANYDQSLWFVAYADKELIGFVLCKIFDGADIYIDLLGVKRSWRGNGIGLSLIHTVFREGFIRNNKTVFISVDSNSLTKANLLYERAGFKTIFKVALFQKEMHPKKANSS